MNIKLKDISIKNKLIVLQLSTAVIVAVLCIVLFIINDRNIFRDIAIKNLYSIVNITGASLVAPLVFDDREEAQKILNGFRLEERITEALLLNDKEVIIARYKKENSTVNQEENILKFMEHKRVYHHFDKNELIIGISIYNNGTKIGHLLIRAKLLFLEMAMMNQFRIALIILAVVFLIALALSTVLQRAISKPLLALVAIMKKVSTTSDYSLRSDIDAKDETGVLSGVFNEMLKTIQTKEKALSELNLNLEQQVKRRTKELNKTNRMLRKRSEELSRSNQELLEFAYITSHDLQEPIRTITSYLQLIEKRFGQQLDREGKEFLNYAVSGGKKMKVLLENLLHYYKISTAVPRLNQIYPNVLVREVLQELDAEIQKNEANIIIDELPHIIADSYQLKQVFYHLISNALKYRSEKTPEIRIGSVDQKKEVKFFVSDNGVGIPAKFREKAFAIFQRLHRGAKYPGAGIGLTVCKRVISRHGGKIWVEDNVDGGAIFYFTLPKRIKKK